jgi:hypothetical protein
MDMQLTKRHPNLYKLRVALLCEQKDLEEEEAIQLIDKQDLAGGQSVLLADPAEGKVKNDDRSDWAAQAVLAFMEATDCEAEFAISDLLGNLRHLCDRIGLDFDVEKSRGDDLYLDEVGLRSMPNRQSPRT